MGYERPVKVVTALKLSSNDQEKILGGNAARLLRVDRTYETPFMV